MNTSMDELTKSYPLGRDYTTSIRLNLQHFLWRDQQGFLLHPNIKLNPHPENVKIADMGTGTGIWLLDVSRNMAPSVALEGFDIDLAQSPPTGWLPHNIRMRKWDIYDDELPEDMIGAYDVVNVRLFIFVVRKNDPAPIVKNLAKMLKPGGYIQWNERDFARTCLKRVTTDTKSPVFDALEAELDFPNPTKTGAWVARLGQYLSAEGLEMVAEHRTNTPFDRLPMEQDSQLRAIEEVSQTRLSGDELAAFKRRLEAASAELHHGVGRAIEKVTFVARKPLKSE